MALEKLKYKETPIGVLKIEKELNEVQELYDQLYAYTKKFNLLDVQDRTETTPINGGRDVRITVIASMETQVKAHFENLNKLIIIGNNLDELRNKYEREVEAEKRKGFKVSALERASKEGKL